MFRSTIICFTFIITTINVFLTFIFQLDKHDLPLLGATYAEFALVLVQFILQLFTDYSNVVVISPQRRQPRSEEKRPLLAGNSSDDEGDEDEHQVKVIILMCLKCLCYITVNFFWCSALYYLLHK